MEKSKRVTAHDKHVESVGEFIEQVIGIRNRRILRAVQNRQTNDVDSWTISRISIEAEARQKVSQRKNF
jgi:hypothetical protein